MKSQPLMELSPFINYNFGIVIGFSKYLNSNCMRTFTYLSLLILLFISIETKASHTTGYDMSITHLTGDTYKVRLTIVRDNISSSTPMPTSLSFSTYINGTNANANVSFTMPRINLYPASYDPIDCPPFGSNLNLEVGIFEYTLTSVQALSLNDINGYYFSATTCCRNDGASNVLNSSAIGMNFTMDFPRLSAGTATQYNSSPRFTKIPLKSYCVGKPYSVNWGCVDPDGDSLVFSLIPPSDGNSNTKPFGIAEYASGYNINFNIMDGVPDLTINPSTGVVNFIPTKIGKYLVGFKCDEWRKISGVWTKIGTLIREFQIETIQCIENPPVTTVDSTRTKVIVDTINISEEHTLTFTATDHPNDSLFMYILPNLNDNLLDPNLYGAKWGEIGNLNGGTTAENLIISGMGNIQGQFKWKPKCSSARNKPYTFKLVTRDQTCPSPFRDTTYVTIFVNKKQNISPYFISPDTMQQNSIRNYYINAGEKFQLVGDSIIKTYDEDSLNTVFISVEGDPLNGQANSKYTFTSSPNVIHSTASFSWQTTCKDGRDTPYKFKFIARDDDCLKHDTATFDVNIYVKSQIEALPIMGDSLILDTSLTYTYSTQIQQNVDYFWYGNHSEIISGQGTNSVQVKWNSISESKLNCVVSSPNILCADTSYLGINKTTGINHLRNDNVTIYPNPTNSTININGLPENEVINIILFDVQGKTILSKEITEHSSIDLSSLAKGIYILKVGDVVRRIVKM